MKELDRTVVGLRNVWTRALRSWERAAEKWDDSVQRQFQREFWEPLENQVLATLREMQRLAEAISNAKRKVH